ncbi:MAG TPA: acyltransferase family protein [Bacteroidales bacterium]|nr:acyltransferase family protein [Bacteroidales bacterium]
MKTRVWFLDNLRTFLIFLVVLLHAGMCYESGFDSFWIVSDPAKFNQIAWVRTYLDIFIMFLIFFISGYFIPVSLNNKSTADFIISKVKRIMIPWIIAVFTLIPAYKAIFLFSRGLPQEEWYSYFHLFHRAGSDLAFVPNNPNQNWLWFLPVLFLFQMVYLAISRLKLIPSKISLKTGVILTFSTGLIYSIIISLNGLSGWAHSPVLDFQRERLLIYFMMFLLGSLCYRKKIFEPGTVKKRMFITVAFTLAFSLTIFTIMAWNLFRNLLDPSLNHYFISPFADRLAFFSSSLLSTLCLMYLFVYIFRFRFNKSNSFFANLSKNSFQVYIIHMIVLGVIALFLMQVRTNALIKYLILVVSTYSISIIIVYAYRRVFTKTTSVRTALAVITASVFLSVVIYIKQADANVSNEPPSITSAAPSISLHQAAIKGDLETVLQHIKAGSDLDEREPAGGSSPLITAIMFDRKEVALALIEGGADINFLNNDGSTPLHTAAFFCRTELVKILLDKGADRNIRNKAGSTALESVSVPYNAVKGIYDYFDKTFRPVGLELDQDYIKATRPVIARMLQ